LKAHVPVGAVLFLSLRMPPKLRLYDLYKETYQIYARVTRIELLANGSYRIAAYFIGKNPPVGCENYQLAFHNSAAKAAQPLAG
jgi:hypothetical protein